MKRSTIDLWLRAMNPFILPRGMAEAQRSARSMVVGLGLTVIFGLVQTLWMATGGVGFVGTAVAMYEQAGLSAADIAMMREMLIAAGPWPLIMTGVYLIVFYGALGVVQWRTMSRVLPFVVVGMGVYRAVSLIGRQITGWPMVSDYPIWIDVLGWSVLAVCAFISVASLQGAMLLHRLKSEP